MGNRITGPSGDVFGLSQALWQNVPLDLLQGHGDRDIGWMLGDDFRNFASSAAPSSNVAYYNSEGNTYRSYEGSSTQTVVPTNADWTVPAATNVYSANGNAILYAGSSVIPTPGQVTLTPSSGNPQAQLILSLNGTGTGAGCFRPYMLTSGVQGPVFFETRLRFSDLPTGTISFFIGLSSALATASGVPQGDGGPSTTADLLGFSCRQGDGAGKIGLCYNVATGTVADQSTNSALNLLVLGGATGVAAIGAAGGPSPILNVAGPGGIPTSVAATNIGAYLKLGFLFDPNAKTLTPYINGIAQNGLSGPNKVITTTAIGTAASPGSAWPSHPMTFAMGAYYHGATVPSITVDWWRCAQLAG